LFVVSLLLWMPLKHTLMPLLLVSIFRVLQDDAELEAAIDAQMKKRLGEADDASDEDEGSEDAADGSSKKKQRQGSEAAASEEGSEDSDDEQGQQLQKQGPAGDRAAQLRAAAEAAVAAKRKGGGGADKAAAAPKARAGRARLGAKLVGDDNITCRIEPELQLCSIQVRMIVYWEVFSK
jgi:hypothetical protein